MKTRARSSGCWPKAIGSLVIVFGIVWTVAALTSPGPDTNPMPFLCLIAGLLLFVYGRFLD